MVFMVRVLQLVEVAVPVTDRRQCYFLEVVAGKPACKRFSLRRRLHDGGDVWDRRVQALIAYG